MPLIRLGTDALGGGNLPLPYALNSSVIPLRLGLSQLGHSVTRWHGTVVLGRYVFAGGGLTPPDPRNAYMFWNSPKTSMGIVPEKNQVTEHFTSQFGINETPRPVPKLGYSFTLGYGGKIKSTYGTQGDFQADGATDFNFSPISITGQGSTGWFLFNLLTTLTGSGNPASSNRFAVRTRGIEYLNGVNWLAEPKLYYPPWNVLHLSTLMVYTIRQSRYSDPQVIPIWNWHVPVVAQYARAWLLDTVTATTPMSDFTVTFASDTRFSPNALTSGTGLVTRSGAYNGSYEAWMCFDSSSSTYWVAPNPTTAWLKLNLGFRKALYSYKFKVNTIPEPNRAPKDWTVSGSNDDTNWTTLDTQTNQTSWTSGEERTFTLGTPSAAYQYFKFSFTANNGDTYLQLQNISLHDNGVIGRPGATESLFAYNRKPCIYLITGSVQVSDVQFDGTSDCAFTGEQYAEGHINITASTAVAINGIRSYAGPLDDITGVTDVAINGQKVLIGDDFAADGVADMEITDASLLDFGMEGDGTSDAEVTAELVLNGELLITGGTDCEFTAEQIVGRNVAMDGATSMLIDARTVYTSDIELKMDGATAVAPTARQIYAAAINMDGATAFTFANTQYVGYAHLNMDGTSGWVSDAVADYFIHLNMDGSTDFPVIAYYNPTVTIVINCVGDMFYDALKGIFQGFSVTTQTDVAISPTVGANGYLEWYTGINTNVAITPQKIVSVYLNMDGTTDIQINVAQNVYGEVIFDQIQQEMTALGSFVRTDGALNAIITSAMTTSSRYIPLGSDYIWGIFSDVREVGSDPMPDENFIVSGKRSRGAVPGVLGRLARKYGFGFSRDARAFYRKPLVDQTNDEWVRFEFFVESATDFEQIGDTLAFTTEGITAIAGNGVFGREKEEYVTYSLLTHARSTQETLEILANGDPHVDVTQVCYEMLWLPQSACYTTQVVTEVLYLANIGVIQQVASEALAAGDGGDGILNSVAVEIIQSIKAAAYVTQVTVAELQGPGDPFAECTQSTMEVLYRSQTQLFSLGVVQQVAVEAMLTNNPNGVFQQVALEKLGNGNPHGVVQAVDVETMHNGNPKLNVNSVAIEEVGNSSTYSGVVQLVAIEMLVRPETDPTVASLVNNPRYHI